MQDLADSNDDSNNHSPAAATSDSAGRPDLSQ
jgi:hypothetical protein